MNECEYTPRLGAYYDGELSPESAAEVRRHVQDCPACAAELGRIKALSRLMSSVAEHQPSAELLRRLHRRVDLGSYLVVRRMAGVLAAAAAFVLMVCSVWLTTVPEASEPTEGIPLWETAAAGLQGSDPSITSTEQQLAMWTLHDLAGNNGHD